jgi:formylmethanofuran dehydrogenase subunit E
MDRELWERSAAFHGHICPGLTIGYKAALYARDLLDLEFSQDEEVVCVTENDACGVDAISVVLGCSVGRGNLLFRLRGETGILFL